MSTQRSVAEAGTRPAPDRGVHVTPVAEDVGVRAWGSASEAELITAQILAVDAWFLARGRAAAPPRSDSREDQTERRRQAHVLATIREAIRDRTGGELGAAAPQQRVRVAPRLVVAHRNAWFVDKLAAALAECGVQLVARLDNGAAALGVVIAEQPDLLVIEDTMALMTGAEVLAEAGQFAPRTLVAVQVQEHDRAARLSQAGAAATFLRAVPPAEVAAELSALLASHRQAAADAAPVVPRRRAP